MMNKSLLLKEIKLASHPTTIIFLLLSFMILIPNYPLYVTFFYVSLGIFFICLQGRENHDIYYTLMLPIKKADIVKGRFAFVLLIEIAQVILALIAALIRNYIMKLPNQAGMDPNIAFFGLSLLLFGIFNYSFFTLYYKDTSKVGKTFLVSGIAVFVYIFIIEACSFAIPYMHNIIDTLDPQNIKPKLVFLVVGLLLFILLTALAQKKSIKEFEKADF